MANQLHVHEYQRGQEGGPTLVLLHGFPVDHRMFDPLAEHLTERARVLGVDLPGLGKSRKVLPEDASMAASAQAVMQSVPTGTSSPLIIAGLSMGGYVAQAIAAEFEDQLAGMILLDTRMTADAPAARENRLKIAATALEQGSSEVVAGMALATLSPDSRSGRPELVELMQELIAEQTGAGVAWSQRAMAARTDHTATVSAFPHELLVIVGALDEISPSEVMAEIAHTAPHGLLETVANAGHMSALEQPTAVAALINAYLARVAPSEHL